MRRLTAIGYKGSILAIDEIACLGIRDVAREDGEHQLLAPIVEVSMREDTSHMFGVPALNFDEELKRIVGVFYSAPAAYGEKHYGPFGDAISLTILDELKSASPDLVPVVINYIAPKAFHKPGLAADLAVIVEDADNKAYFVGIKRKNDPGKGAIAPIGGFLNVLGSHLDTPLE